MQILKIHYQESKPVTSFKEIKDEAEEMLGFFDPSTKWQGLWDKVYAIAHCQVSETPMAFFVVSKEVVDEKMFPGQIIINPVILAKEEEIEVKGLKVPNLKRLDEQCISFPYRSAKKVERYDVIKVRYQTPGFWGLKTHTAELKGIQSQIFQHEVGHCLGQNIFFRDMPTVKWWTLPGTPKGVGGTSLD